MSFDVLAGTYQRARPDLDPAVITAVLSSAVERARTKHHDWDHFAPAVEFLSTVVFTDHIRIPLDDYLETLYCAAKHGDFTRKWRAMLKAAPARRANEPAAELAQ